jgi:hypothetical protein
MVKNILLTFANISRKDARNKNTHHFGRIEKYYISNELKLVNSFYNQKLAN